MNTQSHEDIARRAAEDKKQFIQRIIGQWYEYAPYGDQVPNELPALFSEFVTKHGAKNAEAMYEAFCDASPNDPILKLFECIFEEGAAFTTDRISDLCFDQNHELLKQLGIVAITEAKVGEAFWRKKYEDLAEELSSITEAKGGDRTFREHHEFVMQQLSRLLGCKFETVKDYVAVFERIPSTVSSVLETDFGFEPKEAARCAGRVFEAIKASPASQQVQTDGEKK